MKKNVKIANKLNEFFGERVNSAFQHKFGVVIDTGFSLAAMAVVSNRADGEDMTPEQLLWLAAFSDGYADAMSQVRSELYSTEDLAVWVSKAEPAESE